MDNLISQMIAQSAPVIEFLIINSFYSLTLAVIVLLIKLLYPKLPPSVEYGFWCIVLIRLVLPNDLSFDYAIVNLLHTAINLGSEVNEPVALFDLEKALSKITFLTKNSGTVDYLFLAWSSIVCLVLLRYLNLRFKLITMLNKSQPVVEYWPIVCANSWRLNFWIKKRVIIIAADKFLSPFTFSFFEPVIFIPRKILESNNETLIESIIAHEMAHIKRRDSLWLALQNIIQILYFFNPFVWLIVRQLSGLRESICDHMVLSVNKVKPADYGQSLLQVLRFNISGDHHSLASSHFLGQKNKIKSRVAAIGNFKLSAKHPLLTTCFVCAFAILLLPFANSDIKNANQVVETVNTDEIDNSPFPKAVQAEVNLPKLVRTKK